MVRRIRCGAPAAATFLALGLAAAPLGAQPARLIGHVIDRTTGTPIARASVQVVETGREVVADTAGRFVVLGITPGLQHFRVRAVGWKGADLFVTLPPGGEAERVVDLEAIPAAVAGVTVTGLAPGAYRLVDFERRRQTGRGHYLTESDIRATNASTLVDATRGLRGVTQECGGQIGCRIHMARAQRNCEPDYVVDGRVDNMFGATTPIRDIVALEVYTGPADVPGEFAGATAGCGVVVIWTRSGPTSSSKQP